MNVTPNTPSVETPNLQEDQNKNPPTLSDSAWKRALDRWFQPFLECFWPDIAQKIDWDRPVEELPQEALSFTAGAKVGNQILDKLYKVRTKSEQDYLVITHVEVQGDKEDDFSRRLFEYCYKIYDRYKLPIVPLVLLSDDNKKWRPKPFEMFAFGHRTIHYDFLAVKLIDWRGRTKELLASSNPFKQLSGIYLEARRTRHYPHARLKVRLKIYQHLLAAKWGKDDMFSFVNFLEGVMRLPEDLKLQYHSEIRKVEKEMNVTYLTDAEYIGHQSGLKEGLKEGVKKKEQELVKNMILEGLDVNIIYNITKLPIAEIERLKKELS